MAVARSAFAVLVILAGFSATALAGDGYEFKCANADCAHKATIVFGGGMMFDAVTGYCHKCEKFHQLTWTRPGAPLVDKVVPPPTPLAEVWNPAAGQLRRIFKCPVGEGAFMEIRAPKEITHCPKCGKAGFAVDPNDPRLAVD